jgi:hypothetical protein
MDWVGGNVEVVAVRGGGNVEGGGKTNCCRDIQIAYAACIEKKQKNYLSMF